MPDASAGISANVLLGEIECLPNKQVCVFFITRVFGMNDFERFFEADFLHVMALGLPHWEGERYGTTLQPNPLTANR